MVPLDVFCIHIHSPFDRPSLVILERWRTKSALFEALVWIASQQMLRRHWVPFRATQVVLHWHQHTKYVYKYVLKLNYMCEHRVTVLPSVRVLQQLHVLDKRQLFASPPTLVLPMFGHVTCWCNNRHWLYNCCQLLHDLIYIYTYTYIYNISSDIIKNRWT
jgi:hypothetical protein